MILTALVRPWLLTTLACFSLAGIEARAQSSAAATGKPAQDDPLRRPRPAKALHGKKADRSFKTWLDQDVAYIILPEEKDAFLKLTNDTERQNFIEQFWLRRDPTSDTEENEYKEEHYRRIAFANERFAAGVPGWKTDRGRMYIIHGAPDSIEAHPAGGIYQRSAEEGGGQTTTYPFEVWHYRNIDGIGQNIDIEFVDTCSCGEYHMTVDRGEKDALARVPNAGPTQSELDGRSTKADRFRSGVETLGPTLFGDNQSKQFDRIRLVTVLNAPPPIQYSKGLKADVHSIIRYNLLPFDVRVDFLKSAGDTVLTPVTIQVPNSALTYVTKDGVQRAALMLSGTVTNLTGRVMARFEEPLHVDVPAEPLERFAANVSLYQEALSLRPGHYRLDIMLKDVNGDKLGIFSHSVQIPDFSNDDKLSASTLILADLMDPVPQKEIGTGVFVLGTDRVRPRVAPSSGEPAVFARGQKVNLWMQVYNLSVDKDTQKSSATVEYHIVNVATGKPAFELVQTTAEMGNVSHQLTLQQRVPPESLEPGVYQVTIKVKDLLAQQSIAPETTFVVK
jgi:GWxTD domain-containing protein